MAIVCNDALFYIIIFKRVIYLRVRYGRFSNNVQHCVKDSKIFSPVGGRPVGGGYLPMNIAIEHTTSLSSNTDALTWYIYIYIYIYENLG